MPPPACHCLRLLPCVALLTLTFCPSVRGEAPSFRNEVMAVLSKAGCNAGACHGNQNGKGGFKLSLRGENPDADFAALTRDMLGRRINPLRPSDSLILLKPTAAVPHEGGQRFRRDSAEYAILAQWLAAGMPADTPATPVLQRLEVTPAEQVVLDPTDRVQLQVREIGRAHV